MTTAPDMLYQLGGVPVGTAFGSLGLAAGDVYFVNGADGDSDYEGTTPERAKSTLTAAYDETTNNNNDVVVLVGDSSGAQVGSSALTWSNNYTHLIGACAPTYFNKRARLFHNFDASPIITISGDGCAFENFYFSHGRGSATNKIGLNISGGRLYFGGVHFAGPQHATDGDQTTYSTVTCASGSQDLTFERCVFGHDTIARGNGATSLTFSGTQHAYIKDSDFLAKASNAGATHIEVSSTGIDRELILENVTMINHGTTMTQAIDSNISDTTNRKIIVKPPFFVVGATDVADATGDGTIWTQRFTATANVLGIGINVAVS